MSTDPINRLDTIARWEVIEERLRDHVAHDNDRVARIERRLERIEADVRALLEWRWKLVGALGVIVFAATVLAGWVR